MYATFAFAEEENIVGYPTGPDIFTVEQGQGIVHTNALATIRLPYYTLRMLHGGAFISVKKNTIHIAAISAPVYVQDIQGAWFVLPVGSQWKTTEQQLDAQYNGMLRDPSAITNLPIHYLQEKRAILARSTLEPPNPVVAQAFTTDDLPQIRATLPQLKQSFAASEWISVLTQVLPTVDQRTQLIIIEELIQYEHIQPLLALHPTVFQLVWSHNLLPNAPLDILLQLPFAYVGSDLPAIALEHWYTQLSALYEFDRFSKDQTRYVQTAKASLSAELVAEHPARTRELAGYWERLFTAYPSANTPATAAELQALFTTQLPVLPTASVAAELVAANEPAPLTPEQAHAAELQAGEILRQMPIMFTSATTLQALTATTVHLQNGIVGGKTTDFPIEFTINTEQESVQHITVEGVTYPNTLHIPVFVDWVTNL